MTKVLIIGSGLGGYVLAKAKAKRCKLSINNDYPG